MLWTENVLTQLERANVAANKTKNGLRNYKDVLLERSPDL